MLARLYAECLSRIQRWDEARVEGQKAIEIDPLTPIGYNYRSLILWRSRHYEESILAADKALELNPSVVNAFWWSGLACAGKAGPPTSDPAPGEG